MKKLFGSIALLFVLSVAVISCGGEAPVTDGATAKKECCEGKEKCDHKSDSTANACPADCEKPCCSKNVEAKKCCKGEAKTCAADSAVCADMKAKCNAECGTDSTICEHHKAECVAKCAAKSDSTSVNNCAPDCTNACCSGEEKTACTVDCEKECCAKK